MWITINEPRVVATQGYGNGGMAPGIVGMGTTVYVAAHNLIKGHAKAYHVYDTEFRSSQQGVYLLIDCLLISCISVYVYAYAHLSLSSMRFLLFFTGFFLPF